MNINSYKTCVSLFLALALAPGVLSGCETSGMLPQDTVDRGPRRLAKIAAIPTWFQPALPCHVAGPIFFVGTRGLGVWLIETDQGDILLNTGCRGSGALIEKSIRSLGRDPADIKLLLACHAHVDHVGGLAEIRPSPEAQVLMMKADADLLESGGATDFSPLMRRVSRYEPVKADRTLEHGSEVTLGSVTITALHTPGHTRGSTTFVLKFVQNNRSYTVVFPDGTGINPGYRLVDRPSYPEIAQDYKTTFERLRDLKPDIWLTHHLEVCRFHEKRARAKTEGLEAWVDPGGYGRFIEQESLAYEARVEAEQRPAGTMRKRRGRCVQPPDNQASG